MLHGRISLNSVFLLLLVNFVSGFRLELVYISLIVKYQVKPHSSPWLSAASAAVIVHRNQFFCLYQQNKSSEFKAKFRQAGNCCKRTLEAAKLTYANKTKESTSQKLGCGHFWRIANRVLNRGRFAIPSLFNSSEMLSSVSNKAKLFGKNFSKSSNISLPVFHFKTNMKLHNTSVTPKMVKKVVISLDSLKASGLDCISVVVLKNCEPELSYVLGELFNKCLKESSFPDCWNVSLVGPVFKNVRGKSTAKNN